MRSRCLWGVALSMLACATCGAQASPDSFRLTAGIADLDNYYPTYLANGFWSIASTPSGTQPAAVQMAGLMDRSPGDVSRPAGVPSFGEVDYFDGGAWLNAATVTQGTHQRYQQVLDMSEATLATRYRWRTEKHISEIKITSFVSGADPHLGIVAFDLIPRFSGDVRLRFTLRAPPAPKRLKLAEMSADEFSAAAAAASQADAAVGGKRDVIWYPGEVRVTSRGIDASREAVWMQGHAVGGKEIGLALAIQLPKGLRVLEQQRLEGDGVVGLEIKMTVTAGAHYQFTKFASAVAAGWGLDNSSSALKAALHARRLGYGALRERHRAIWRDLWRSDIRIDGDRTLQRTLHSDLFYLLENTAPGAHWPAAACGFSSHYFGHVFWDNDFWVFPALLLLHPERARGLIESRRDFLVQAEARARVHGFQGAMYPWEADPASGEDVTPKFAAENASREIHVNSAVALAQWQYFLATHDRDWLARRGFPVMAAVADFWASRASFSQRSHRWELLDVTSPEEDYTHVDNEIYTNVSARQSLLSALAAAKILNKPAGARWSAVAEGLYMPTRAVQGHYLEFDATVPHDKNSSWMASSVPMLSIPALDFETPATDLQGLFAHASKAVAAVRDHANQMILVMIAIQAANAGNSTYFADVIGADVKTHDPFLKPPFNVRSETPQNDSTYLLASSGGFLQAFIYGLTGMRLDTSGLVAKYPASLPDGVNAVTLEGLRFRGRRGELTVVRNATGGVERTLNLRH